MSLEQDYLGVLVKGMSKNEISKQLEKKFDPLQRKWNHILYQQNLGVTKPEKTILQFDPELWFQAKKECQHAKTLAKKLKKHNKRQKTKNK